MCVFSCFFIPHARKTAELVISFSEFYTGKKKRLTWWRKVYTPPKDSVLSSASLKEYCRHQGKIPVRCSALGTSDMIFKCVSMGDSAFLWKTSNSYAPFRVSLPKKSLGHVIRYHLHLFVFFVFVMYDKGQTPVCIQTAGSIWTQSTPQICNAKIQFNKNVIQLLLNRLQYFVYW